MRGEWQDLPIVRVSGVAPFFLGILDQEIIECADDLAGSARATEAKDELDAALKEFFRGQYFVQDKDYDRAKKILQKCKARFMDKYTRNESEKEVWYKKLAI